MTQINIHKENITNQLSDEFYKAFGLSPDVWFRKFVDAKIKEPISAFADICARFEDNVVSFGFTEAAKRILPNFVKGVYLRGSENIPAEGPLLITSNHPGTCDSLVIASTLPRGDLKIIAGNIIFLKYMPATQTHLIHTTLNTHDRMMVLRKAIRHLKNGGALLLFGSGGIDPEPAYMPGAEDEIDKWSPSLSFILKKIPDSQAVVAIISNLVLPKYLKHPLTFFRKQRRDKQRISEFLQVLHQMMSPSKFLVVPKLTFSPPIYAADFYQESTNSILSKLIHKGKELLVEHQAF